MGTMGLPSRGGDEDLCFLAKLLAASSSEEASKLPLVNPSAARKERRFQASFKFMNSILSMLSWIYFSICGSAAATGSALPTISISESPGIHSTAIHDREGVFPGAKYVP